MALKDVCIIQTPCEIILVVYSIIVNLKSAYLCYLNEFAIRITYRHGGHRSNGTGQGHNLAEIDHFIRPQVPFIPLQRRYFFSLRED